MVLRSKGIRALLLLALALCHGPGHVLAKNDNYQMSDVCKKYFLRDLYRKIDGAVLISQNERDLDCAITFQTHSILQRFMLRFDELQLDCNDHLYIYDGAHAVGNYKAGCNIGLSRGICIPQGKYSLEFERGLAETKGMRPGMFATADCQPCVYRT
ncbi:hypothetical protein KM043_014210 [Ampulex compressa]|nr:hypothetical protein KM043_014210 [Ampulex compressa]